MCVTIYLPFSTVFSMYLFDILYGLSWCLLYIKYELRSQDSHGLGPVNVFHCSNNIRFVTLYTPSFILIPNLSRWLYLLHLFCSWSRILIPRWISLGIVGEQIGCPPSRLGLRQRGVILVEADDRPPVVEIVSSPLWFKSWSRRA